MKVIAFKVYQPVYFGGKQMNIFNQQNASKIAMTLLPGLGVQCESEKDLVIVSWNNVAYAQLERAAEKKKLTKAE